MNTGITVLLNELIKLKPIKNSIFIIHSSLILTKPKKEDIPLTLDALFDICGPASTLCFPTFTFGINENIWKENETPGQMGTLNEYVRRKVNSKRSIHPTHSFAVIGAESHKLTETLHRNAFGLNSTTYEIIARGAFNISLGAAFEGGHTYLHSGEELNGVPYRSQIELNTVCLDSRKVVHKDFKYFARNRCSDGVLHENNWNRAWEEMTEANLLKYSKTKYGLVSLSHCQTVLEHMKMKIKADPFHYCQKCIHAEMVHGD